jgi:hypothetical protein
MDRRYGSSGRVLPTKNKSKLFSFQGLKKYSRSRHQWLTPVILATQEAEIRRIEDESQPSQIIQDTLSQKTSKQKNNHKNGLMECLRV